MISKLATAYLKSLKLDKHRFRDRRAHYASSALSDIRDQYWELTGEPVTDRPDAKALMTMGVGTAVEQWLVSQVFSKMHLFGVHPLEDQVPVGGTEGGAWDGYLDAFLAYRTDEGKFKPFPVEIKTNHGYGGDLYLQTFEVKEGYMVQLGLYLKDLYEKKGITQGVFCFVTLSDKNFGVVSFVHCEYLPDSMTIRAYKGEVPHLDRVEELDQRVCLKAAFEKWERLQGYLDRKECPPPDYHYKLPLTPENLAKHSLNKLEKAARGEAVLGDWQPLYSRYFKKILEVDKVVREHTAEELVLIKQEIGRRKVLKNAEASAKRKTTIAKKKGLVFFAEQEEGEDE